MHARLTPRQIWGMPIVIGVLSGIGLLSALLGDGIWDLLSWLFTEAFRPALRVVSNLTPGPLDLLEQQPLHRPIIPLVRTAHAIDLAKAEAARRGWAEPASRIFYDQRHGYYSVSFFPPGDDHGTGGMGVKRLYLHGADGHVIADRIPFQGTAADVFVQLQFPVHSGRILGLPGRIAMPIMGVIVVMLSVTGLVIRYKRRGGLSTTWKQTPAPAQADPR